MWSFLIATICFLATGIWAVRTRPSIVFEKDHYYKQSLVISPYIINNIGPDHKYMTGCQITETGTLKGIPSQRVELESPPLGGDFTETWHGPCYVEIRIGGERKIIWGKKLVKVENALFHSVHVTIE